MFDLVGIGALNVDYIATRDRLRSLEISLRAELSDKFELGTEKPASSDDIDYTLQQMGSSAFEVSLGGSAFNTIQGLAALAPGLRLGYIGVAGGVRDREPDFLEWFRRHKVDSSFVQYVPELRSGTCISYINEGERSLLTCPGANIKMSEHLQKHESAILDCLGKTKIAHITSFFDNSTPGVLANIVSRAKQINPWLRISFDPGHNWVFHLSEHVRSILQRTDYLFLNEREFKELGRHRPGHSDASVAQNIFGLCQPTTVLIVLKRYDQIVLFSRFDKEYLERRYVNVVLMADEIQDATGAGDVFAAGFLAGELIPSLETSHSVELALRMVKHKLRTAGTLGFGEFPSILREFLQEQTIASKQSSNSISMQSSKEVLVILTGGALSNTVSDYLRNKLLLSIKQVSVAEASSITTNPAFAVVTVDPSARNEQAFLATWIAGQLSVRLTPDKVLVITDKSDQRFDTKHDQVINISNDNPYFLELEKRLWIAKIIDRIGMVPSDCIVFGRDFRSVNWLGSKYTFSVTQSKVIEELVKAWLSGVPDVHKDNLLEKAESISNRLQHIFKSCDAWKNMITSQQRGMYRLNAPIGAKIELAGD